MVASIEQQFISSFHSLNGITIGERKKNLFLLLNTTRESLELTQENINFSSLHPKSLLEKNFKVDALLYFKKTSELLQVLKSGNPMLIEKILNTGSWFIEDAFRNVSGKELATEIFPHLSYNTKLKLLHKFGLYLKDVKKAEEYFEAIKHSYGVYIAAKMLMACSSDMIIKMIEENKIEITSGQLQVIVQRHPDLTEDIFEKLKQFRYKVGIKRKYIAVFKYLAGHDIKLFLKLKEKHDVNVCLGSRCSVKAVLEEKEHVIRTPEKYFSFLKRKQIIKGVKGNFDEFYLNCFPKSLRALRCTDLMKYLDVSKRFHSDEEKLKYFLETFRKAYGNELWNHREFVQLQLIEMMSSDTRENWMNSCTRPENFSEEAWISLMKIEKSVPLLIERISYTSKIKERVKLAGYLVKTCKINNDSVALLEVLRYFISKHKNDHILVTEAIIQALDNCLDSLQLTDEHWNYINEFIAFVSLKNEYNCKYNGVLEKYIYYCLERNVPVKDLLLQFVQGSSGQYSILRKNPAYERRCLLMFNDTFPTAYKKEDLDDRHLQYLQCICDWNKRHPEDTISLFINPQALESVRLNLAGDYCYRGEQIATYCIKSDFKKSEEANLIEPFLKTNHHWRRKDVINQLIRTYPESFIKYIKIIAQKLIRTSHFNSRYFPMSIRLYPYYSHLDTSKHLSVYCLSNLNNVDAGIRKMAAYTLSLIIPPDDFLSLVASNYPTNLSADVTSPEDQRIYKSQQALLPSLRNVIPPSLALDAILKFCKGDYLSLIQRSLYSPVLMFLKIN